MNDVAAPEDTESWTTDKARDLYMIDRWGAGYFGVREDGDLTIAPLQERGKEISIREVVDAAVEEGLPTPLLIRFQDLLRHRVRILNQAFQAAIDENKYLGNYRGVFPIKVNQLREVVEEILEAGRPYHYGIEVGSKPEIFAALAVHTDRDSLIVCNGYKDDNYIRTALLGRKLGKKVILVAEKLSEVRAIIRVSKEMNVTPFVGLRVRLVAKGGGKWATSAGEHAKFGLTTAEMLEAIQLLQDAELKDSFKLLHFHIGSQVPDILIIKRAVREAARHYAKLYKMGVGIEYVDVGGGLAVDYDGSNSTFHASMNYTVEEYARDVVYNITDICDEEKVPHPDIVSESGRAIVAHHSVLVVEAFGSIAKPEKPTEVSEADHKLVQELAYTESLINEDNLGESWHDAVQLKEEAQTRFELGLLDLPAKAKVEELYWKICKKLKAVGAAGPTDKVPDDFYVLDEQLSEQYICNFSVFQSLLDHWALDAMFPVLPIQRLNEEPTSNGTIVDITCDSDGKISKFIDAEDVADTVKLHLFDGRRYYVGICLTGAYQDIMGDIHNLFGRVNEAHVFLDDDEECGYYIEETISGNRISEVLSMTQYQQNELISKLKSQVDAAIKQDKLKPTEGMRLLGTYERGLQDQTYLSFTPGPQGGAPGSIPPPR